MPGATGAVAPDFALSRRGTNEVVRLADFAGQIVVLDFFAYWCVPCQKASGELEEQIAAFYAARGGNPAKTPVRLVAINVEPAHPARTDAFIRKHRLGFVLDDDQGKTLDAYAGRGLPFIVILDGTSATRERPEFTIAYRNAGYEGAEKLRRVIDRLPLARTAAESDLKDRTPARSRTTARPAGFERHGRDPLLLANTDATWQSDGPDPRHGMITAALTQNRGAASLEGDRPEAESPAVASPRSGPPIAHRLDADIETMFARDVRLIQGGLTYAQTLGGTEWEAGVALASLGFHYQPVAFDFLGEPRDLDELRTAVQAGLRQRLFDRWILIGAAGGYDGFTDFRSAWINEYFRQQFGTLPGYEPAAPRGLNARIGLRWEYLPASGFLQFDAAFLKDQIAPGYEIDFDGLRRGRPVLYTTVWALLAEQVLTPRLRSQIALRLADTTEREPRYAAQGWLNWAVGEGWVWRATGGYTAEEPTFEAWFLGVTLEREIAPSLWLTLGGRYYADTGEIENSLFSTAAPGLRAWQAGLGARYTTGAATLRLFMAPYFTDYDPFSLGTAFFGNLYRDRSWGIVQLAYNLSF